MEKASHDNVFIEYCLCFFSDDFQMKWEENLTAMCGEIEACKGATELVEELARIGIPMAIATSSRYVGVEKKRTR